MFKKPVAIITAVALSICLTSSAFAAFANYDLIRVISDSSTTQEIATNLGNITTLSGYTNQSVGDSIFSYTGSSSLDSMSVTYFAVNRSSLLNGTMFIASNSTTTPATPGVAQIHNKLAVDGGGTGVNTPVLAYYNTLGAGQTVVANNTDARSLAGKFGTNTLGNYGNYALPFATTTNLSLANLATTPITMTVYRFGNNTNMATSYTGVKMLDVKLNSDGTSTINPLTSKLDQATVTVSAPANATYGQPGLLATASGGDGTGAYSYSAGASTACTVNTATGAITITSGSGSCSITATRAGDSSYNDSAASAPAAVVVGKAPLTVAADNTSRAYGAANPTFTASYSGFVNGENLVSSGVSGAPALSSAANATTPVGTADITAAIGTLASSNYSFSFVNGTLTITGASQLTPVTVTAPAGGSYGQTGLFAVAAGGDGSGAYSYDAGISTACTVNSTSGALSIIAGTGTCTITAIRAGDSSYNDSAASAPAAVVVGKAPLTVTADDASRAYGAANPTFTATYSGFVNGELIGTSGVSGAPDLSSSANATTPVGTADITAAIGTLASSNYSFSFVNGILTISKAAQTTPVTVTVPPSATYGQTGLFAVAAGGDSSGAYSFDASGSTACSVHISTGAITITSGVGNCSITATKAGDSNYNASPASAAGAISISKATPAITWATPADITYGTPLSAIQLNAATIVPGTFTYSPVVGTVLSTGTQTLSTTFTPTEPLNYTSASSSVTITVVPTVRIAGDKGYDTLLAAVQAVSKDSTIQLRDIYATTLPEALLFNNGFIVKLEGGMNQLWDTKIGVTNIKGNMTIRSGKVTVNGIKLRP